MSRPIILVLASGLGRRFRASGGEGSKLDAMLGEQTVLERTLAAVRASGLPWHVEDAGHPGMGDSIAAGVQATRDADGWLVLPGDLPFVQPGTLRLVANALSRHAVVLPMHGGRGHPVGFAAECGDALAALTGEEGAASVVKAWIAKGRAHHLPVDDAGVGIDIDTLADLQAARQKLSRGA